MLLGVCLGLGQQGMSDCLVYLWSCRFFSVISSESAGDKGSPLGKTQTAHMRKAKPVIHSLLPFGSQVFSPSRKAGLILRNGFLGRPSPLLQMCPTSSLSTPAFVAEHDAIWCGTSPWSAWASCPGCVPSQLLGHPSLLAGRAAQEAKPSPRPCVSTALQHGETSLWCHHCFHPNPKLHCVSFYKEH